MKKTSIALVAAFILSAVVPPACSAPSFEGGTQEAIATLSSPGFNTTVNLLVPANYHVTNATLKVNGLAATDNASAFPENVTLQLNGSTIWEFRGTGYGPMGMQDRFSNGSKEVRLRFGAGGGSNETAIRLPGNAVVQSAQMRITGSGPDRGLELLNITGAAAGDTFGHWVGGAGDVNNDGYDDLIVGAPTNDAGGQDAGRAYIFFGSQFIDGIADVVLTGATAGDNFGQEVSTAGDVNGDGFDDVIVGAPLNGAAGKAAGAAYIFFGGQFMDSTADVTLTGMAAGDNFGFSASTAGDVNNDGYDDVMVGAQYNATAGPNSGEAYLFLGGRNMDSTADLVFTSAGAGDMFGRSVSTVGDVNMDGYDDVMVGALYSDSGGSQTGSAYLYCGGMPMDNISDIEFTGQAAGDLFGFPVSCAGDPNNDGVDDILIGAQGSSFGGAGAGQAYIFFGGKGLDNIADVAFTGMAPSATLGNSLSSIGDWDGDGFDDVMVGGPTDNTAAAQAGIAHIFFGGQNMDNLADVTFKGQAAGDYLGDGSAGIGDMNKDGYVDVAVGADQEGTAGAKNGKVCIYSLHNPLNGTLDPNITIGSKIVWTKSGYFNGNESSGDLASVLNDCLRSAKFNTTDKYGNSYQDISIKARAGNECILVFSELKIVYTLEAVTPNFAVGLNDFLVAHEQERDENGDVNVPLKVGSASAGRVRLSGLDLARDAPPELVKPVGDASLDEDSINTTLIDLYQCYRDNLDPLSALNFSVTCSTNASLVKLWITSKRYLAADAFTGSSNDNWTGTVQARVACSDRWGLATESNEFTIFVRNVNDPPTITSTPGTIAEAGVPYYYDVTAMDGDNDMIQFSLPKAPSNMSMDDRTGAIQWMPRGRGTFNVSVVASDGNANVTQGFSIFVPNKAPRITSTPPLVAKTGVMYVYNVTAEDENLDPLTFSIPGQIIGMEIGPKNGTITWTPAFVNTYDVGVLVSDGEKSARQEFTVKVSQGNRAPRFISVPDKTATVGVPYVYLAKAVDDDKDSLSLSLLEGPSGMTFDSDSGEVGWTPSAPGNFTVKMSVVDSKGMDAVQEYTIKVVDRTRAKVGIDRPAENETVKGKVTISGTAVMGTIEVVSVQVRMDGGDWTDATGNYTWQHGLDSTKLKNGRHLLEARAFDGKDHSELASVNFTVKNQRPAGKGFIPMLGTGGLMLLGITVGLLLPMIRRKWS